MYDSILLIIRKEKTIIFINYDKFLSILRNRNLIDLYLIIYRYIKYHQFFWKHQINLIVILSGNHIYLYVINIDLGLRFIEIIFVIELLKINNKFLIYSLNRNELVLIKN